MDEDLVVFRREPPAGIIRVNRERKLNAMNRAVLDAMMAYLVQTAGDPELHATIITGTGRAFIAGADIGEYWQRGPEAFAEYQRLGRALLEQIERHPKPVIAAVNGAALGGGFELALACDVIVAGEAAVFGLPEPRLGLVPGGGGTQRLTRAVGRYRAKDILLLGRQLSAQEAQAWGLVARVAPAGSEAGVAQELGERIAGLAPLAVRAAKRLVNEGEDAALEVALSYEQQTLIGLYATADGQEGINAFMEKRAAVFTGK
jgi:enoyl-CoA hydratase/carnithine racemase